MKRFHQRCESRPIGEREGRRESSIDALDDQVSNVQLNRPKTLGAGSKETGQAADVVEC